MGLRSRSLTRFLVMCMATGSSITPVDLDNNRVELDDDPIVIDDPDPRPDVEHSPDPDTESWLDTPAPISVVVHNRGPRPTPRSLPGRLNPRPDPNRPRPSIESIRGRTPDPPSRRGRRTWSSTETECLVQLFTRHGAQWRLIQEADQKHRDGPQLHGRSNIDLKDKIRNIKLDFLR
jgi:hypothetical protein